MGKHGMALSLQYSQKKKQARFAVIFQSNGVALLLLSSIILVATGMKQCGHGRETANPIIE